MLQESHHGLGKSEACYTVPGWTVISSPDPNHRWAGVVTMVSHRAAHPTQVQYQSWRHGRILQVRFPAGRGNRATHIVFLIFINGPGTPTPTKKRLEKQAHILIQLDKALHTVPRRHSLCIAGDFTCQLQPREGCIGPSVSSNTQLHAPDHSDLAEWIASNHLCVLNTWSKAAAKPT